MASSGTAARVGPLRAAEDASGSRGSFTHHRVAVLAGARHRHRRRQSSSPSLRTAAAASSGSPGQGGEVMDPNSPFGSLMQSFMQVNQAQAAPNLDGASVLVRGLGYRSPGTGEELLKDISLTMPANRMGLLYGRSGAGKTTLLNTLAGLTEPTSGEIELVPSDAYVSLDTAASRHWAQAERRASVGMLFQFPERHFLGGTVLQELTVGWPTSQEFYWERHRLAKRMERVIEAVGLQGISLEARPNELSGGYKRRLALAVQLVRGPRVLLMDEPLAGLDWQAREGIVQLLGKLKQECTLLVVSHDLKELMPIVDVSWRMLPGGKLESQP